MTATAANPSTSPPKYKTAADWLRHLGDVPPERIIFDPLPGTATEADLLRRVEVEKQLCELIDGTLVEKPTGWYESILASLLAHELLNFILPRGVGAVSGADGPLRLRLGLVRLPDVAYVSSARLKAAGGVNESIPSLIPDLAVEVVSPTNTRREMARKREEYFAAGVRLVWIIDPPTRSADVYSTIEEVEHIEPDGIMRGGMVLPGFELRLSELFGTADKMLKGSE